MVTDKPLAGQRILVTRPQAQADNLIELIQQAGGEAIRFPVISILPVPRARWGPLHLEQTDWLIFVSRNAVNSFIQGWQQDLPPQLRLAAVGDGTASAMREAGLTVDCQPAISNGSEGLLQMSAMQNIQGKQVLIVRGVGGRERLADTLTDRGASITYVEVYCRTMTEHGRQACIAAMYADKLISTSVAGLDNLCRILAEFRAELFCKPLLVVSERIRDHARSLGFRWVEVSADASDTAVLNTLIEMDKQHGKQ
ncbi:uroporphyrinogen-III synthase [Methylophaga sp. OBS1]|uniref:uroporphyrinogen-III synthase n=1 Tax=Methylophaga sp. OBS1 TaxID=2991933 RepID=UPI00224D3B04|nr:uroporphyrinogen-III synthase [Methylophaga sp. OBS1]MCX4192561.1 uroporphyrinogen-III synthase [Methylophaga sp. OBS1]